MLDIIFEDQGICRIYVEYIDYSYFYYQKK